jgi:putative permease
MTPIRNQFDRLFGNPQVVILIAVILTFLLVVLLFGNILMPVFAGLAIAYLLEGPVQSLQRLGMRRIFSVLLVFLMFMTVMALLVFGVVPKLALQIVDFAEKIPEYTVRIRNGLNVLPERYPEFISAEQVAYLVNEISVQLQETAKQLAIRVLAGLADWIGFLVYLFLVPVLVFFFMKDKDRLLAWLLRSLPKNRSLVEWVAQDVNVQMSKYLRGKAFEMVIVGIASYLLFYSFGLNYAILLATLVGMSVFVPIVGAIVMTFPVVLVGYFKYDFSSALMWLTIAYVILQQLDGNVLVPILFSEVNNLHPVAIITAVMVFGSIWGFWGVFFAIPLATLVQAVLMAFMVPRLDGPQPKT